MNDVEPSNFIQCGIHTSKADIWVHISPFELRLYWYFCDSAKQYITRHCPPTKMARSKDGSITGYGYLIDAFSEFIKNLEFPEAYLSDLDWSALTDNQAGRECERIAARCIENGIFVLPLICEKSSLHDDLKLGIDLRTRTANLQVKCDKPTLRTHNLFVQKSEFHHSTNAIPGVAA